MRSAWAASGFADELYDAEIDHRNQMEIQSIITEIGGWPQISIFGNEVADALWVLVQHAPDTVFQRRMLREMKKLPSGEVSSNNVARTIDRIRIREGKKQLYGTSFTIDSECRSIRVDPIEDEENIDNRRREMGLDKFQQQKARAFRSFKEYLRAQRHPDKA